MKFNTRYIISFSKTLKIILAAVILFIAAISFGQKRFGYNENAEKVFSNALTLFKKGEYKKAAILFQDLCNQKPLHQRTTAANIMVAKAYFQLGQYKESIEVLLEFLQVFPETEYYDDARYTLGLDYMMLQNDDKACLEFLEAYETTDDNNISNKAFNLLETLSKDELDINAIKQMLTKAKKQESKNILTLAMAEKHFQKGEVGEARQVLDTIELIGVSSKLSKRIQSLREKLNISQQIKIGAVLSLMKNAKESSTQKLSTEVLQGIEYAIEENRKAANLSNNIFLDVRDDSRDTTTVKKILEELSSDREIVAVIGPLFSNLVSVCTAITNDAQLPLISPTANANGLASSGNYIYQVNPDLNSHGKALARYAVAELGHTNLAILTPDEPACKTLSESFSQEIKRLGANIAAIEIYHKDSTGLHDHFMKLRHADSGSEPLISFKRKYSNTIIVKMIRAGANPKLIDSMRVNRGSIPVTKLFGPRGKHIAESLNLKLIHPKTSPENIERPVMSIQAIFLPVVDPEEIGALAAQLKYYNIQAQILGSTEWNNPVQLELHKRDADGAIFISDFYLNEEDTSYTKFNSLYSQRFKKQPGKYFFYGYDTMKLLLDIIAQGAMDRNNFASALNNVEDFKGLHIKINLNTNRVNTNLHVLKFNNGQILKIGEVLVN